MPLPPTFADLSAAYNAPHGAVLNVIGVVVDLMPPTITRKQEYMLTLRLLDQPLHNSVNGSQGLTVRFFKPDSQALPQVGGLGDIVLLRKVKSQPYNGQALLLSSYWTGVLVFPGASIPEPNFLISYQGNKQLECRGVPNETQLLTPAEQAYVIELKNQIKAVTAVYSTLSSAPAAQATTPYGIPTSSSIRPQFNLPPRPAPAGDSETIRPESPAAMRRRNPDPHAGPEPKKAKVEPYGHKLKLVEQLRHYQFADICAEVVKKWSTAYGCDLYVTDYTENKELYHYAENTDGKEGDAFDYTGQSKRKWQGPFGYRVLKVNVKHPHSSFVNSEVEVGDFVMLKNVKMKIMNQGTLEGDMWPDHVYPDKIMAGKAPRASALVDAILERKDNYWAARRPAEGETKEPSAKLTKTARKKLKKQAAAERESRNGASKGGLVASKPKSDTNEFVRCNDLHVPVTSVCEILDSDDLFHKGMTKAGSPYNMPFVNIKHRAKVRCIDFAPKDLSTFSIPYSVPADEDASSESLLDLSYSTTTQKFEWNFSLLLEDASSGKSAPTVDGPDAIWVTVGHSEAQFLFGNDMPNPDDLAKDGSLLAKLREKLCILWGNLAETKATDANISLSNRPFECCIAEFGVRLHDDKGHEHDADRMQVDSVKGQGGKKWGWQRCYRMFGVTIL